MTVVCLRAEGFNVFRVQQTTGAVTGHAADTVTDSAKSWTPDEWHSHAVKFTSGNHNTRSYSIISNTANTLTCTIPKGSSVSGENIGTGDGITTGFSGTLADPVTAGTLSITDTVETFTDNGDGTLTGNNGGTGTITYTTGAWSVTFGTAPLDGQAITADYDPLYNFNCDGGVAVADTFEIIEQGEGVTEDTTPPGSADLPATAAICLRGEGFNVFQVEQGTGSVTGRTEDTITDSAKSWTPNEWHDHAVKFTSGNHNGRSYSIASNTADTLICVIPRGPSRFGENIGTGDGITTGFSGTLADPVTAGTLSITDTIETFSDNGLGTLTGNNGGTGTITYTTGAWSVTFGTAPVDGQAITADYDPGENIGTGDGTTTGFSGTLADPVNVGTLSITDTVETFADNGDGTLTGNNGGSGSIIYETGAWSVTFGTAPTVGQAITADYDPLHNFNCDGGVAVADTFEIIYPFCVPVLNTTPPGRADMEAVICLRDEGFNVFRVQKTTGAVTGHTEDTVTDSSKSWTPDEWHTHAVKFTSGNHNTRSYSIFSNTATALTCTMPKGSPVSGVNIGTGDGATKIFSGTLADPVDPGTLSITDTWVEVFTDNSDGTLTGDKGGTGTITYSTGAWSVTFNTAPANDRPITADYTPLYNLNCDGGVANGNTFEIIEQGEDFVENTTPPGSADLPDQPVIYGNTVAIPDAGFILYLVPKEQFTVSALVAGGVEDNTQSWTENDWVSYWIEFTSGALNNDKYVIAINSTDVIYGQGINFSDAGVVVNDTFKIRPYFFLPVQNTTPPGSADLVDQAVLTLVTLWHTGFRCPVPIDMIRGRVTTPSSILRDAGIPSGASSSIPTSTGEIGYKVIFTSGPLSGNSYIVGGSPGSQGIHVAGSAEAIAGSTYYIVPFGTGNVDQATLAIATCKCKFYLWLDPTNGAIFTITALTGEGVTVSGAGWTENEWVQYRIKFESGTLCGEDFFISSNTDDDIYSEGLNLGAAGAQVGDTFKITSTFFILSELPEDAPPADPAGDAPPVFGPGEGRGWSIRSGIHSSRRYGFFSKGASARGSHPRGD